MRVESLQRVDVKPLRRRWPACRAYSAEVASATNAGSSGVGTVAFFIPPIKELVAILQDLGVV